MRRVKVPAIGNFVVAAGLGAAGLGAACSPVSAPPSPAEPGAPAIVERLIADADLNGKSLEVPLGAELEIRLESIPTAGYSWFVRQVPTCFELVGETTEPTNPETQNQPGFTGGNHWIVFRFRATSVCEGQFALEEGRAWEMEGGTPPSSEWVLDVRVPPAA